jgi:hypothetical protein
MAWGRKTGGRQKGTRNLATEEARVAAAATGILPLDYMLTVMRGPGDPGFPRNPGARRGCPKKGPGGAAAR